jgi:hypothetical protein
MAQEIIKNTTVREINETATIVKEDATMANEVINSTEAIETTEVQAPEVKLPKFNDVIVPADEDRLMLYITATRNKNDAMFWDVITVAAGEEPKAVLKTINENKFVNLVDMRNVRAFVEAGAPLRGMASTISDFAARFAKTKHDTTEKAALVLREFKDILVQVDAGTTAGKWENPEAIEKAAAKAKEAEEKAAAKAAKEAEKAAKKAAEEVIEETDDIDPYDVEDAE